MKLALSSTIKEIDKYHVEKLKIPISELVDRSGEAIARFIRSRVRKNESVIILAGTGNNGADGYSLATKILSEYEVTVFDVFGTGPKVECGRNLYEKYKAMGGKLISYSPCEENKRLIKSAKCIVDAVFGTGFVGSMPDIVKSLSVAVRESVGAYKIAVDVPLGVNADNGSISDYAISVDATVVLSFVKPGIISYPARFYVGEMVFDDIGLKESEIAKIFDFRYRMIDFAWVKRNLPHRPDVSHKGSFGKLFMITGSEKYRGAAHLSLEGALRGGVGLVSYAGPSTLISELSSKFPEVIYEKTDEISKLDGDALQKILALSDKYSAVLVGSGSDNTDGLLNLVLRLCEREGAPLILDADAINALSRMGKAGCDAIKNAKRTVILTPHPLELARLIGEDVSYLQQNRLEIAEKFAKENNCIIALKGAGTIVTNGNDVYINAVASSSLAKAGSGDVLAGLVGSLAAQNPDKPIKALALAVYFHSKAGVELAKEYSDYGVTPSDLPLEIARQIAKLQN
jgi:NAD(P)H-hydrate epimerase